MNRNNCFNLMRMLAALLVLISHHASMMKYPFTSPAAWIGMESFYVFVFITLSGYLVTQSFYSSTGFVDYLSKRVKRIFPALIFCCAIVTFLFIPFFESSPADYLMSGSTFKGFMNMSVMHGISIPGAENIYARHTYANAPLWSLPYEFALYLILGLALGLSKNWKAPAVMLCVFMTVLLAPHDITKKITFYSMDLLVLSRFGVGFCIGSMMFLTKDEWNFNSFKIPCTIFCISIVCALVGNSSDIDTIGRICIAVLIIVIGVSFNDSLIKGKADISYGLYIWAWPVQCMVISSLSLSFLPSVITTILITCCIATFSRIYIEEPFLKRRKVETSLEGSSVIQPS